MKKTSLDEAIEKKYPEKVALIVTKSKEGKINVMPAGWFMFTSHEPRMIAVSVGLKRHTHKLLNQGDEFVVTFPSRQQKKDLLYCGKNSGADVDKISETDLKTVPSAKLETPLIDESVACFECLKKNSTKTGDHTIFSGEIVAAHISEREKIYTMENWHKKGIEGFKTISEMVDSESIAKER
ncbi:MAG: flavin reductase family protein [Candidatus Hadarchaeota archaeon]